MGTGYLEILTTTGDNLPIQAKVTVLFDETVNLQTNENGVTDIIAIGAPPKELSLDPGYPDLPYSICDIKAQAEGFATISIYGVKILDTETITLPIKMIRSDKSTETIEYHIPAHQLIVPTSRRTIKTEPLQKQDIRIPEFITVHLGEPDSIAQNVRVPFIYYIKNVASNEVYSTWPPASLEANIYCVISQTLNRIYTKFYRVQGHDFDITSAPRHDQMFVKGGQIFRRIDEMVDQIFNRFILRDGMPYFTEYSDGRHVTCPGLWKWNTVDLANRGFNALQILHHFYPQDVEIVETYNIDGIELSFPGYPIKEGMSGRYVRELQTMLNKIRINYPAISEINDVNDVFGAGTKAAVQDFQGLRVLGLMAQDGIVDRNTWYRLSFAFSSVKQVKEFPGKPVDDCNVDNPPAQANRTQRTNSRIDNNILMGHLLAMYLSSQQKKN